MGLMAYTWNRIWEGQTYILYYSYSIVILYIQLYTYVYIYIQTLTTFDISPGKRWVNAAGVGTIAVEAACRFPALLCISSDKVWDVPIGGISFMGLSLDKVSGDFPIKKDDRGDFL